jgi:hypothetical protein
VLATPHMLVGATIGAAAAKRPRWILPALVAALASHYALDVVPHTDTHTLFGAPGGYTAGEVGWAVVDVLIGAAIVAALARRSLWPGVLIAAAMLGILPDVDNVPGVGARLRMLPSLSPAIVWHHAIQHTPASLPLGLGTQAFAVAGALWVLWRTQSKTMHTLPQRRLSARR